MTSCNYDFNFLPTRLKMFQVDEAQACLKQAQKHWQSKQWQQTIQACAQALALNRQLPQAHKLMGDALQRTNKAKEAIGYYREAIRLQPDFAEVYANLGSLYAQQQQYQQAIDFYRQALKINPEFAKVQTHLDRATTLLQHQDSNRGQTSNSTLNNHSEGENNLQNQRKLEAVLQRHLAAAEIEPQIATYQEIVKLCEQLGRWADAAKYCRLILRLGKDNFGLSESRPQPIESKSPKISSASVSLTSSESAPTKSSTVSQSESSSCSNYLESGKRFIERGDYSSAIAAYRKAVKQQPDAIEGYIALGELSIQLGQLGEAASYFVLGLKQQHHPELYFGLGKIYHAQQQWSKALLCYQKAVEQDPNFGAAYHELGEIQTQQSEWLKAVAAYRQAIALNPDFSWSYNNLGYALIQLERWSEAIPVYQQAVKLNPDFVWSYYNLAEAYSKSGQWAEAIANYQRTSKLQPDLSLLQQKLGDAFYRRSEQDRQQALEHFLLAIEQNPESPDAYHQALAIDNRNIALYLKLGDLLADSGKSDRALVVYQMALQIQPKNNEILARIHQYQGDIAIAAPNSTLTSIPATLDYESTVAELQSTLPHDDCPTVSIIIPVYNQLDYTLRCLKSIADNLDRAIAIEIILVNDCSSDRTAEILGPLKAVNLIDRATNQGFIYSCNQGAAVAKGEYLYFLNNDTELKPHSVASLITVLAEDEKVGAVGSKLVYPQGSLQEAGAIIWQDASGWNYGRQENPHAPEYNYLRPVDYCSGASLMVRKSIFDRLNGFETEFAPAYYEDTDLCFAIRHQFGMEVMYQPKSEIIHYEGISSGTSVTSGTKKYQVINAAKFKRKWHANLLQDYLPSGNVDLVPAAARKYLGQKTILVVDSYMPSYDRESGSRRLFELLKMFKALDYHVIFAADNGMREEPYASMLQNLQIEVLYTQDGYGTPIEEQVTQRLALIDLAWICRPELNQKYAEIVRQQSKIKLIYDTIDLHYLRLKRAWELDPTHCTKETWIEMHVLELKMAHQADLTVTVTTNEREVLQHQAVDEVAVIPNVHTPYRGEIPSFSSRSGILFIGSYNHLPNIDAVIWLCTEIMPLVWNQNPDIKVTLLGNNPPPEVYALESDRVTVTGYIDDVSPYFLSHKLSVSPLRYGAGMKGKIGHSLEYALPVVSTQVGTEGMNLVDERHILEASDASSFAQQILRLYSDANLWNLLSNNALEAIAPYTVEAIEIKLQEVLKDISTK